MTHDFCLLVLSPCHCYTQDTNWFMPLTPESSELRNMQTADHRSKNKRLWSSDCCRHLNWYYRKIYKKQLLPKLTVWSFWSSICDVFASTPTDLVHTDYQCTSNIAADKPEKTTSDSSSGILAAAIHQVTNNPWHHFPSSHYHKGNRICCILLYWAWRHVRQEAEIITTVHGNKVSCPESKGDLYSQLGTPSASNLRTNEPF